MVSDQIRDTVVQLWEKSLEYSPAELADGWFDMGGDSLGAVSLVGQLPGLGVRADLAGFLADPRLGTLLDRLEPERTSATAASSPLASGPLPLTPAQQLALAIDVVNPDWHNDHFTLAFATPVDWSVLDRTREHLCAAYPSLTARFDDSGGSWCQYVLPPTERRIRLIRVPVSSPSDLEPVTRAVRREGQALRIRDGRLTTFIGWECGGVVVALTVLFHHLAADGHSIGLLQQAIDEALSAGDADSRAGFHSGDRYAEWLAVLKAAQATSAPAAEPATGEEHPAARANSDLDAWSFTVGTPDVPADACLAYVVTRLVAAMHATAPARAHTIDVTSHGREPVSGFPDLSRTVGWFARVQPLTIPSEHVRDPGGDWSTISRLIENLRADAERWLCTPQTPTASVLRDSRPSVYLNYRGTLLNQLFATLKNCRPVDLDFGPQSDPAQFQPHALRLVVDRQGKSLRFGVKCDRSSADAYGIVTTLRSALEQDAETD